MPYFCLGPFLGFVCWGFVLGGSLVPFAGFFLGP